MTPAEFAALETEKGFLAKVIETATLFGWKHYHPYDSRRSAEGFPDLVLARPGEPVIFAELKVGRRQPTRAQRDWSRLLQATRGVEAYIWWPKDFDDIARRLRRRPMVREPSVSYSIQNS